MNSTRQLDAEVEAVTADIWQEMKYAVCGGLHDFILEVMDGCKKAVGCHRFPFESEVEVNMKPAILLDGLFKMKVIQQIEDEVYSFGGKWWDGTSCSHVLTRIKTIPKTNINGYNEINCVSAPNHLPIVYKKRWC